MRNGHCLMLVADTERIARMHWCICGQCGFDWHIGIGNHSDIEAQFTDSKVDSLLALQQLYHRMGTNASSFVTIIGEENCDHWPTIGAHPGCHSPTAYYQDHMCESATISGSNRSDRCSVCFWLRLNPPLTLLLASVAYHDNVDACHAL